MGLADYEVLEQIGQGGEGSVSLVSFFPCLIDQVKRIGSLQTFVMKKKVADDLEQANEALAEVNFWFLSFFLC